MKSVEGAASDTCGCEAEAGHDCGIVHGGGRDDEGVPDGVLEAKPFPNVEDGRRANR